jgi:hypothetical protein
VFNFYQQFWQMHGIEHLGSLIAAEVGVAAGSFLHIPLLLHNTTNDSIEVLLQVKMPDAWYHIYGAARYHLTAKEVYPVQAILKTNTELIQTPQQVIWTGRVNNESIGSIKLAVSLYEWTLPQ